MTNWNKLLHHKKQSFILGGVSLVVEDGVFTPDPNISYSASIIINNLPSLKGLRVADVGTGSGVIAIAAALRGASEVIATDISEKALSNTKLNITLNKTEGKVTLIKTNLLDGVEGKFDLICANLPILEEVWNTNTVSSTERFLSQAKEFLSVGGKIYLPWGSFANVQKLEELFNTYGYNFHSITEERLGFVWYLYILEI